MNHSFIIIGGGIGGLTCAIAMAKRGFEIQVFEQAAEIRPLGAGITLGVNAMRVFKELGLAEDLIARGNPFNKIGIKTHNGRVLNRIDIERLEDELGMPSIGIHRAELHNVLIKHLPPNTLNLGEKFVEYKQGQDGITAIFESGKGVTAGLLIGADGIHSRVREEIVGTSPLRDAKQICFRGVCDAGSISWDKSQTFEAWGKSKRFGIVPIGKHKIYWFLTINRDQNSKIPQEAKEYLLESFGDWYDPVPAIISHTESDAILRNDLYDRLPIDRWHDERAVLLGDAAHPTTPNMGQGAAMAIESAAVLASCLEEYDDLPTAIEQYERLRMPRTQTITKRSWSIGQIATVSNPLWVAVRNLSIRLMSGFAYKGSKRLFEYDIYALK